MKNHFAALLLHVFFILLINNVRAQINVTDNNAAVSLASNAIFFVTGSVQVSGAGNILNNGNFYVGVDFTNNGGGLKAASTGTVIFNGLMTQRRHLRQVLHILITDNAAVLNCCALLQCVLDNRIVDLKRVNALEKKLKCLFKTCSIKSL